MFGLLNIQFCRVSENFGTSDLSLWMHYSRRTGFFSSHDLSCWSSFVGLVSTRSVRVHALCSRMHQPIGRQVLAPAQWDICFAWPPNQGIFDVSSGNGSQFWRWIVAINCTWQWWPHLVKISWRLFLRRNCLVWMIWTIIFWRFLRK